MCYAIRSTSLLFALILVGAGLFFNQYRPTTEAPGYIAFISTRTGQHDIYIMDGDGHILQQIQPNSTRPIDFIWWEPNGRDIRFRNFETRYQTSWLNPQPNTFSISPKLSLPSPDLRWEVQHGRNVDSLPDDGLYSRRFNETQFQKIYDNPDSTSIVWLDSKYFYFDEPLEQKRFVMSVEGQMIWEGDGETTRPSEVVDDKWLIYKDNEGLWLTDFTDDNTNPSLLIDNTNLSTFIFYQFLDERIMLIKYKDEATSHYRLALYYFATGEKINLISVPEYSIVDHYFLPEQNRLIFTIRPFGNVPRDLRIYMTDLTTLKTQFIHQQTGHEYYLSLSGDRKWLAFQVQMDGSSEIFRMRTDGTALKNLTNNPNWDIKPVWSPFVEKTWHPDDFLGGSLAIFGFALVSYLLPLLRNRLKIKQV